MSDRRELQDMEDAFGTFWAAYPRKTAKITASRAFEKAIRKTTLQTMVTALAWQRRTEQWQRLVIPLAATWLNQERWTDEPMERAVTAKHLPYVTDDQSAEIQQAMDIRRRRTEMLDQGMDPRAIEAVFEAEYQARVAARR